MYNQKLREMVHPPSQNTVAICNQITFLILYSIIPRLVTPFKVTDVPIKVPNIFILIITFKLHNFRSQIFLFSP
jgi:hypothetical protein